MATEVLPTDQIDKIFNFFETKKTLLTNCTEQWKKLSTHFTSLDQSLLQKSKDLDSKLQTLDSQTQKTLESLQQRETSIPDRESSLITLVEQQKQSALTEFEKTETGKLELVDTLKSLSRKMDSVGLLRFMTVKRKEAVTLRNQIGSAIAEAVDSPKLVLDAVEDYIGNKSKNVKSSVSDRRWACSTLISALFPSGEKVVFASGIVERAVRVAESWKGKIESEEGGGGAVEAAMFLQFVVGFGLVSKFEQDFLMKLVSDNPSRRDMPKLASALGLGEKLGDMIDELVKSSREIDAVYFAFECGLTERFQPVDLLKNYLKRSKARATTLLKDNKFSASATENASYAELNSLKSIIKCVEDHKLESVFSLQNIKKRASQLEKLKADKRKSSSTNKRTRGVGGGSGSSSFRPAKYGRGSDSYSSYGRRNPGPVPVPGPAAYSGSYNYPSQGPAYKGPSASYTSHYGAHTRSPAGLLQHYSLPPENIGSAGDQVTGTYGAQANYNAYDYTSVPPPSYQPPFPQ